MIDQQVLFTSNTPSPLILLGADWPAGHRDLMVTDDESDFNIYINGEPMFRINCDGRVSIVTVEKFIEWTDDTEDYYHDEQPWTEGICGAVLLRNCIGPIGATAKLEDGTFTSEFDLQDYVTHQFDDYPEVIVNLPSGSSIVKINDVAHLQALLEQE